MKLLSSVFALSAVCALTLNYAQAQPHPSSDTATPTQQRFSVQPFQIQPETAPATQLELLRNKYRIQTSDPQDQTQLAQAVIVKMARRYNVPEAVALGVSGHESGHWKMWQNLEHKQIIQNQNKSAQGRVLSTDWGIMQINDQAHPEAFPAARYDLEFNIEYGVKYLKTLHTHIQGSLNMGFGDWDRTIAAYNLGHNPRKSEIKQARRYLTQIKARAIECAALQNTIYTVQPGDTLSQIAYLQWGDAQRWEEILLHNPTLKQASDLRAGMHLQLPV